MITLRRGAERGHVVHDWLDTWHTFSFASYQDRRHVRFRSLRVMNEDRIAPGQGFGMHPHHDMEIVTYVLSGALQHQDSLGNGATLRAGEFQRMTAGTGILHSEFNPSSDEPVHLYQIWLLPETTGLPPSYEQREFVAEQRRNRLCLVASPDAADGSLIIRTPARIYLGALAPGVEIEQPLRDLPYAWVQVLRGRVQVNGEVLAAGDGVALTSESLVALKGIEAAEVLLFELA